MWLLFTVPHRWLRKKRVKICVSESESPSVVSSSLQPHGLYSPWNSPGQNTGVGNLSLFQGIFSTQGLNPGLPHCRQMLLISEPPRSSYFSCNKDEGVEVTKVKIMTIMHDLKPAQRHGAIKWTSRFTRWLGYTSNSFSWVGEAGLYTPATSGHIGTSKAITSEWRIFPKI